MECPYCDHEYYSDEIDEILENTYLEDGYLEKNSKCENCGNMLHFSREINIEYYVSCVEES